MIKDPETFYKLVKEEERNKELENRKKMKRFDDIFRMLFLVITIMVSFGSSTFQQANLWATIGFILLSLIAWMIGHAVGAHSLGDQVEVSIKLLAWSFASLVAPVVFLKFAFKLPTIGYELFALCTLLSICFTILPYRWLREALSPTQQNTFLRNLSIVLLFLSYSAFIGVIVI